MMLALVNDNVVVSVVTDDPSNYGNYAGYQAAIDITDMNPQPAAGWTFDGNTLHAPPGYVPSRKITKLALRNRFTFSELITLQTAAQTSIPLQVLKDNLAVATYIDLSRPDTIAAINMLVSMNIITSDRANTILTAPITAVEAYGV
jgi:hypothetical protein